MADLMNTSLPQEKPRGSEDNSNNSSAAASRHNSGGLSNKHKLQHRVKFSVGAEDDHEEEHGPKEIPTSSHMESAPNASLGPPRTIPEIRAPRPTAEDLEDSEDVASVSDITLKTPDWSGRANTAALHAHNRAERLASRLTHSGPGARISHSAPGSRRSSLEGARPSRNRTYLNDSSRPDTPRPGETFFVPTRKPSGRVASHSAQAPVLLPPSARMTTIQKKWSKRSNQVLVYPLVSPKSSPPQQPIQYPVNFDDIPLEDMTMSKDRRPYSLYEDSTDEDSHSPTEPLRKEADHPNSEAHRLVRTMTRKFNMSRSKAEEDVRSGTVTPNIDKHLHDLDYIPPPTEYKAGILSSLLRLYDQSGAGAAIQRQSISGQSSYETTKRKKPPQDIHDAEKGRYRSQSDTPGSSGPSSGKGTPQKKAKWYDKDRLQEENPLNSPPGSRRQSWQSTGSMAHLLQSSMQALPGIPAGVAPKRSAHPRSRSSGMIAAAVGKITHPHGAIKSFSKPRLEDEIRITVHIAEVLARQRYMIKLCRALMIYGAPTYRLEEYMRTSARVLQIEGQFLYLPGCMVVSFDDPDTHTTEVKLVKEIQGVDLGKFKDTFIVYKNVLHDVWGVEEATKELEEIIGRKEKFPVWVRVLVYGLASMAVGPFAFGARPIDFPIAFILGCVLGILQLVLAPKSEQFQHVFEVAAAVITSFLARAFGSITHKGEYLFCFSALAQSSIALILPGYIILCASLELQSRNIVAGSVRMVYAIIYALFLGFGITIGTALFGLMDSKAVDTVTCTIPPYWTNVYISHFPFVPLFTLCLIVINQAKWRQAPVMLLIAFAGYQTNFWASKRLANNVQVANALGAFVVGSLANLYSRFFHGLAAAAMLPAIFVQVPSGLAASGSLVAGLTSAEQITGNVTGITVISNGTQGFYDAQNATSSAGSVYSGTIFNVGYGMVQVAIGISVGLFLSALVVYPVGKKRSGLFSF